MAPTIHQDTARVEAPHAKVKPIKMAKDTWGTIVSIKKERLHAKAKYTRQSLLVLNLYGTVTADTLINDSTTTSSSFSVAQQDDTQAKSEQPNPTQTKKMHLISRHPSDHDDQDEDDGASGSNIKELLFTMGYQKIKRHSVVLAVFVPDIHSRIRHTGWNQKEKALLDEVSGGNPLLNITSGLDAVIVTILKKTHPLDDIDLSLLNLCLSGVVNLPNPAPVACMKLYHPTDFGEDQVGVLICGISIT
ncbi:hypothetical protein DFQ29_009957 [Apophysomyces sp. BC1021]|nr:hypothetical protein DFQ29_009957 [Apophysomyces sp. BC1021]